MLDQLLLSFGVNVSSGLVVEGVRQLLLRNPNATKSDLKRKISDITKIDDDGKIEQIYNLTQGDQNIVIGNNSTANGSGNIVIGHNRNVGGSNNIIIG